MSIKLFVTDLDGTLLPAGQEVPAANIKAVRDMVAAGVIFTIATGRMYFASVEIARSLGVDVPIITYNGALIKTVGGEIFHSAYLDPDLIVEITNFCQERNWHLQSYSNDNLYYPKYNDFARGYEKALKIAKGTAIGWDGMRKYTENVPKLLCVSSSADETAQNRAGTPAMMNNRDEMSYTNSLQLNETEAANNNNKDRIYAGNANCLKQSSISLLFIENQANISVPSE